MSQRVLKGVQVHVSGAGREERNKRCVVALPPPANLLLFLNQFSSCIFITEAINSSAGRVTSASHRLGGGEGGRVSRQTNATQVFYTPTCGIENVYEWTSWTHFSVGRDVIEGTSGFCADSVGESPWRITTVGCDVFFLMENNLCFAFHKMRLIFFFLNVMMRSSKYIPNVQWS